MANKIQIRRGLASLWVSVNPTLSNGEFGYETDTGKTKIGNGVDDWNTLGYEAGGSGVSQAYVDAADALKVDKVSGQSLINITDITKLAGIEAGAQVNDPNTVVAPSGVLPVLDGSNLTGLPSGAAINDSAPSTSTLYSSSKTLTLLGSKVDKVTGMGLSTNDFTDSEKVVVDNTSGTNTGDQDLSGKVDKVTGQSLINTTDITKLAGIATGAQVNDPNTTTQGNTFNGVSQLVKTDGAGKLPAIDGSQLTGISGGGGATINDAVINTTNAYSSSKIDTTFVHKTDLTVATLIVDNMQANANAIGYFNGATGSYDSTNKRWAAVVTGESGTYGRGVTFGGNLPVGHRYMVHVNTTSNGCGLLADFYYGFVMNDGDTYYTINGGAQPATITSANNGTFYVNYVSITEVPFAIDFPVATKGDIIPQMAKYAPIVANTAAVQYVKVGQNNNQIGYQAAALGNAQIVNGQGATASITETGAVVIGVNAKVWVDPTYGVSGGAEVAIGQSAVAGAWRAIAIGGYATSAAVSTTTVGFGACNLIPHCTTIGRGAYNDLGGVLLSTISSGNASGTLFLGGVAAKTFNPSMPAGGETIDVSPGLLAGTGYFNIRATPGRDASPTPTLTNVPGCHIVLMGGSGTGTAKGGDTILGVTLPSGTSNNTMNADFYAIRISGTTGSAAILSGISLENTTLLSTPVARRFETDGTDLYWTNSAGTRKKVTIS